MSKASLETEIRNQVLQTIIDAVNPISDILPVSASELEIGRAHVRTPVT